MIRRSLRPRRLMVQSLEARDVPAASLPALNGPYMPFVADRVLVQMSGDHVPKSPLILHAQDLGNGLFAVDLKRNVGITRGMMNFRVLKGVQFTEPDFIVKTDLIPNDLNFGSLWGLNNTGQTGGTPDADIDAPEAWDVSTGSGSVAIGIIDTGMDYRHQDLYRNVWINQAEIPSAVMGALTDTDADGRITFWDLNDPVNQGAGKITDLNGTGTIDAGDILTPSASGGWADGVNAGENGFTDDLVGWNFVNNTNNPFDDNAHGTHVAGTIGATGNDGVGVAGINWRIQMAPLKFLNASGSGSISAAISALNYAVAAGLKATNNSWGGGGFSAGMSNAITAAQNAGQIFVAAAGNSNSNNDGTPNYPSNYPQPNVVAVGSSTSTDARSSFSSYGATTVDLFAPGSSILSSTPNNTYSTFSGTSMATPHVTGSIALVWDAHPGWTFQQVIDAIKATVDVKPAFQGISVTGGRLNLDRAIRFDFVDRVGPKVTASAFSNSGPGVGIDKVRFTFNESIDPATFVAADDVLFIGPAGAITGLTVTQVAAGTFDVTFAQQTTVGTYSMTIGPNIADVAGNAMDQNSDGTNAGAGDTYTATQVLSNTQTFSSTDLKAIRDVARTISTLTINQDLTIADLNLTMNLSHTWDSDLRVTLIGPDATSRILVNRRGGSGDNFATTTFNDEAGPLVTSGSAPFNGSFRPEQSLTGFDGKNARGLWQLVIDDLAMFDTGRVNSWSLTIQS